VAAAFGGIENYYDMGNLYPNVVSLVAEGSSFCTGSLIDSRTILTAAHCPTPNSISFTPIAGPGVSITSFVRDPAFVPPSGVPNDIAVISLAQPVPATSVAPVKLLMLQPGQAGFPTVGTTITMVGYGLQGTGSFAGVWKPDKEGNPPPAGLPIDDGRRREGQSSLGQPLGVFYTNVQQPLFVSQFRNPLSPGDPNFFKLQVPVTPLAAKKRGGMALVRMPLSPAIVTKQ
jgi:subtilase-type serine protease